MNLRISSSRSVSWAGTKAQKQESYSQGAFLLREASHKIIVILCDFLFCSFFIGFFQLSCCQLFIIFRLLCQKNPTRRFRSCFGFQTLIFLNVEWKKKFLSLYILPFISVCLEREQKNLFRYEGNLFTSISILKTNTSSSRFPWFNRTASSWTTKFFGKWFFIKDYSKGLRPVASRILHKKLHNAIQAKERVKDDTTFARYKSSIILRKCFLCFCGLSFKHYSAMNKHTHHVNLNKAHT